MKEHWRSIDELTDKDLVRREIAAEEISQRNTILETIANGEATSATRRDFLKLWGFGLTTAALVSACERPVQKAIPYLIKPEEITPGVANHYATTFFDGEEFCSLLVKSRDGRPIKIEGNELCPITRGGTTARIQASVLNLYDNVRYQKPTMNGQELSWENADGVMKTKLEDLSAKGLKIVLLTQTIISPSAREIITRFLKRYPGSTHISYDSVSSSAMLKANEVCFGKRIIPSYHFENASLIISFFTDFLGSWLMPVQFTRQYVTNRKLDEGQKKMSKHIQLEAGMSLTGSNADKRIPIKPSEEKAILVDLYSRISSALGHGDTAESHANQPQTADLAIQLLAHKGESLIVSSTNDQDIQLLVNAINYLLGNYGHTIDLDKPLLVKEGMDTDMVQLLDEMVNGKINCLIAWDVNPLYDYPDRDKMRKGLGNINLKLTMSSTLNETTDGIGMNLPDSHYLEKWGDAEPVKGVYTLAQPLIDHIYNTRQAEESLMKWSDIPGSYYDFIREYWKNNIFNKQKEFNDFEKFWSHCLQNGVWEEQQTISSAGEKLNEAMLREAVGKIRLDSAKGPVEVSLYTSVAIGTGKYANNPWLQELPDPIAKISWENFAAISPKFAEEKKLQTGDVIKLSNNIKIPVYIQPGQAYGVLSIALGYGRTRAGKVAEGAGVDVSAMISLKDGLRSNVADGINFEATSEKIEFALSQTHHSMEGRPIVRETILEEYLKNPVAGNEMHEEFEKMHQTLYPDVKIDGFDWTLSVDLNSCIGCSACAIACQAENNIPVVGKEQVKKRRLMHWIRVDRYYAGDPESPETMFQPVMCQHCDNAPCENVCPVGATTHSNEGLNQMAYNRCIGTKYCINNCPYRVRRFNWFRYVTNKAFDYNQNSDLGRMVLNPDVVVRERGVVEKCSFCVQRIQEVKLTAKLENRVPRDGEIQPACVQACPAKALTFGDINNKESKVNKLFEDPRRYGLLEELHTLPSVGYLTKVRNIPGEEKI
jgi:MoCo/4Fe-4S cofactor protein with predicted Tat translocation signal